MTSEGTADAGAGLSEAGAALVRAARREGPGEDARARALSACLREAGAASAPLGDAEEARLDPQPEVPGKSVVRPLRRRSPAVSSAPLGLALAAAGVAAWMWSRSPSDLVPSISSEPSQALRSVEAPPAVPERVAARASPPSEAPAPSARAALTGEKGEKGEKGVRPGASAVRASAAPLSLGEEIAALDRARSALAAGDAKDALAKIDRYDALGGNRLRAEATLVRIEALARAGQGARASELARKFVAENPTSPLAERARSFAGPGGE